MSAINLNDPSLLQRHCLIAGEWRDADTGETFPVTNPATGEVIALVPLMGAPETVVAIEAANAAWPAWRALTAKARHDLLMAWFHLILANAEDLALLITSEQGKPLAEARGEVTYAASFIEWFAQEGRRVYGQTIPSPTGDRRLIVLREPVGVCAAITPWNFPLAMITRKVGPALAAGNVMIVKPAEATPLSALALAVLAQRAGIPRGVLQVITGVPAAIGGALTASPIVRKLSFTGSTEVGRLLYRQSGATIKKLSLELGGNAPFIVFEDADLDAAVEGAMASKFRNAGQTCVCANRIYVHASVYDQFTQKLVKAVGQLVVGDGLTDGVTQGPLIDQKALEKVELHIADALGKGAKVVLGGNRHSLGSTFFQPTILTGVNATMLVAREETFGPLAPLFSFQNDEEIIAMANDTEFGLASYFYSRDIGRVWRVAEALEYGMVGVNTGIISNEVAPFGGIKQSGLGREGGSQGIEDYLVTKYVAMAGL